MEDHRIINSQVTGNQKTFVKLYSKELSETKSWEGGIGARIGVTLKCCQRCRKEKNMLTSPHGRGAVANSIQAERADVKEKKSRQIRK